MTMVSGRFLRSYALFVTVAGVLAVAMVGLGYLPTIRLVGREAVPSMVVGCGVSWVASCIGSIPVAWALSERSTQTGLAILASTVLRFITALLLVVPLTLSGRLDRNVLVFSLAVSYLLMLAVDTVLAIHIMKRGTQEPIRR